MTLFDRDFYHNESSLVDNIKISYGYGVFFGQDYYTIASSCPRLHVIVGIGPSSWGCVLDFGICLGQDYDVGRKGVK